MMNLLTIIKSCNSDPVQSQRIQISAYKSTLTKKVFSFFGTTTESGSSTTDRCLVCHHLFGLEFPSH